MDSQDILPLISRWFHVIPAIVLVGGTLFMRLSLVGPLSEHGASDNLREAIRLKWASWVKVSILFLLVSGLYNAYLKAIGFELTGMYLGLLTVKIILSLAIFFFISVLTGKSNRAKRFREREEYWLNIVCAMMLVLVSIAGGMKMSQQTPKTEKDPPAETRLILSEPTSIFVRDSI